MVYKNRNALYKQRVAWIRLETYCMHVNTVIVPGIYIIHSSRVTLHTKPGRYCNTMYV